MAIRAMDGPVAGLTWADFQKQFQYSGNQNANGVANIAGIGAVGAQRLGGQTYSGEGSSSDQGLTYMDGPPSYQYLQDVGNGTDNYFSPDGSGGVIAHNQTRNNDSWWDSTGFPLLASLGFGGAAAAGGAFAGAGAAGASGAAGEGLGAGATGAFDLGGTVGGVAGAGGTAEGLGTAYGLGTAGDLAAAGGYYPSAYQGIEGGGFQNVAASGTQSAASDGVTGAFDMGGTFGGTAGAGQYATGLGTAFGGGAGASGAAAGGGFGGSNPLSAISNIYNGTGTAADYWSLLQAGIPLANGLIGSSAARSAANTQANAANQSNALLSQIYGESTARNAPFVNAGTGAINQQANLLGLNGAGAQTTARGQFQTDPGYQFALDQGLQGVQRGAAAAGGLNSGRAMKDLNNYAQGQASQQYGNYFNRLSGVAGMGQASANNQAQLGANYGAQFGNNLTSGASANAAGTLGSTNAWTGALSGLLANNQQNQLMQLLAKQNGYYG